MDYIYLKGNCIAARATFSGDAWFHAATFFGKAEFGEATFSGDAATPGTPERHHLQQGDRGRGLPLPHQPRRPR